MTTTWRRRVVIFDWHGVLDRVKYAGMLQILSEESGKPVEEIQRILQPFERDWVTGKLHEFWYLVRQKLHLDRAQAIRAQRYIESIDLDMEVMGVVRKLYAQGFMTAVLSDAPIEKAFAIRREVELSLFFAVHFSGERGLTKDDEVFFANLCMELHIRPDACVYIDDSPSKLEIPRRLGFCVHQFVGVPELVQFLEQELQISLN